MEAKKIAEEMAALLELAESGQERKYREHVLTTLARMEVKQDNLQDAFERHVDDDDRRFGTVTQKIGDNSSSIAKGAGVFAALMVMIGVIMWLLDKVRT